MKFSVLISVYHKEIPAFLDTSLNSIEQQSLRPNEIVVVKDGPLTAELERVIEDHKKNSQIPYTIVALEKNRGLGVALNKGLEACLYSWIARMDGDDIAIPERFEKQIAYLKTHENVDVLGSWIMEFSDNPEVPTGTRKPPCDHKKILKYAKYRNPLNHMTVIFRKEAVEKVGGYQSMNGFEDYYLWIRMMKAGYVFANIDEVLVKVRTGKDMISRRHGWRYIKNEWNFAKAARKLNFFSGFEFCRNIILRSTPRILPASFLHKIYAVLRNQ